MDRPRPGWNGVNEAFRTDDPRFSCPVRIAQNAAIGAGFGAVLAAFKMDISFVDRNAISKPPVRARMALLGPNMLTLALVTGVYEAVLCTSEMYRGERDGVSSSLAGCAMGGTILLKAGPPMACAGCVAGGALSYLMFKYAGNPRT
eukprot:c4678_g1_i2.p1 GENE.c4678_g1_i2~~c4678_g1_i2.p1  ORF type:complete len:153 (+),score=13.63 c4678_g1_i2:22-459(+)